MNPIHDHHINKHAIANEEFKFACANCGKLITTTPGAPGSAQVKCNRCGHTMLYFVDPQQKTANKSAPPPIRVRLYPSKKFPGDFQIKVPLEINKRYSYLCANPDCSKIDTFTPRNIGSRRHKCKWCSTIIHYQAVESGPTDEFNDDSQGNDSIENQHCPPTDPAGKQTEPISRGNHAEGLIEWRWWHRRYIVNLDKDLIIIGRDDKDNPCDIMIKDKYMSACSLEIRKEFAASGGIIYLATVRRATNPVLIQQREYPENSSIYLNDGDIIKMGKTTLTFKLRKDKT